MGYWLSVNGFQTGERVSLSGFQLIDIQPSLDRHSSDYS